MKGPQQDPGACSVASIPLTRSPSCSAEARRFVRERLGAESSQTALENVMLVVSELVTNAFQHGEGTIELLLRKCGRGRVRVEVRDEGAPAVLKPGERRPDGHRGWGLHIVELLAEKWGSPEGSAHVWAELPLS